METISERIKDIQTINQDLFAFAFNLRKQDTNNKYTRLFLEGNIKSTILIEIFCSNVWRDQEQFQEAKMEILPNVAFKLKLGDAILQYPTVNSEKITPILNT